MLRILSVLLLAAPLCAEDWPRFRGPAGNGISTEKNLPLKWSETENIAWKTPIEGNGWSSPTIVGDRIFLTACRDKDVKCHVLCIDRRSGKILWDKHVFDQKPYGMRPKNSHATPTAVCDGERVYAVFGEGGIAALTVAGEVVWTKTDIGFASLHGLGASPVLVDGLFIMPYDGSSHKERGGDGVAGFQRAWDKGYVLALDAKTGKEAWRTPRGPSRLAHCTPLLIEHAGKRMLITPGGDVVQALDPKTGKEIWNFRVPGEGVTPSPVYADGMLFCFSGFPDRTLRRLDPATGKEVWQQKKYPTNIPTVTAWKGHLYSIGTAGQYCVLEMETGKIVAEERFGGEFSASPLMADGRIYLLSESGETLVLAAKPEIEILARNPLKETAQASPTASDGKLYIRTKGHLWCVGK